MEEAKKEEMTKKEEAKNEELTKKVEAKIEKAQKGNRFEAEILSKATDLMTGAFALIAALAWNDAIQTLFKLVFGDQSGLIAKFIYALAVTLLLVLISMRAGWLKAKLETSPKQQQ